MPTELGESASASWRFIEDCIEGAGNTIEAAYDAAPGLAQEVFPEDKLEQRQQVLAHKLIEYASQRDSCEDLADINTIRDALLELAPTNFTLGSRREEKARVAINQWFDPSYKGRRIIGSTLASVVEHHHRRSVQQSGELRRSMRNRVEHLEPLHITGQGFELLELKTRDDLRDESAMTGHCIGTLSHYGTRFEQGTHRYFSLRNPNLDQTRKRDEFKRTAIEYSVAQATVLQIKGRYNAGVRNGSHHLSSVVEALAFIRDSLGVSPEDFTVRGIDMVPFEGKSLEDLSQMTSEVLQQLAALGIETKGVMSIDVTIDDDIQEENLAHVEKLGLYDVNNFTFNSADTELLSRVMEYVTDISGDAYFPVLTDASSLSGLHTIGGRAFFQQLESSAGLSSLTRIGKSAHFMRLKDAVDLTSLEYIGSRAHFEELLSAKGLEKLKSIGGRAYFNSLKTSEGLEAIEYIGSHLHADLMDETDCSALRKHIRASRKQKHRR